MKKLALALVVSGLAVLSVFTTSFGFAKFVLVAGRVGSVDSTSVSESSVSYSESAKIQNVPSHLNLTTIPNQHSVQEKKTHSNALFVCFVVLRPSQQLWSCRDSQLT